MSTFTRGLRSTTATTSLLVALGAPAAIAQQANVTTNLGVSDNISTSAVLTAENDQELIGSGGVTTNTTNNVVSISITANDSNDYTASAVAPEIDNLISASATGNLLLPAGQATAILGSGTSTSGDTVAVGTLQDVQSDVTATSTNDTHSIVIENTADGIYTLTGSALQENNDITADATGNDATSSITVESGLDVDQAAALQASVDIDESLAGTPDSNSSADLVVSSSQEIDGVEAAVDLSVTSTVDNANTTIFVEDLALNDGATVSITESDQASTATGNLAENSIESLDTTASITGSTAIANLQSIVPFADGTVVTATTTGSTISVTAGDDSNSNRGGDVASSTVSLTDNTQSATSTGSDSTQTLTLDASSITGEGLPAVIVDSDPTAGGGVQLSADGDAVIGNVQRIEPGVSVSANTVNNEILSSMTDTSGALDVTTSTLELDGNTQSAAATGVSTSNALSLTSGATMSAAGAVASVQSMDGAVTASTTGNSIENRVNQDPGIVFGFTSLVDSSMLTTNNTIESTATGASAANTLSTTTATNNLSVDTNGGSVGNGISAGTDQPSVTAGQALTNDQDQSGSILAEALDNQIFSYAAGLFEDSTVTTDGNTLSASATANAADNAVTLAFNDLTGTISGTGTGVVAATANDQTLDDNMTVTARNVGTGGTPVLVSSGTTRNSSVSTSDNTVSVSASGNVTTGNDVLVDATNITSGSEATPSITASTGALTAGGSFVSASTQISGADILASQIADAGTTSNRIETQTADNIDAGSTVLSDNNALSASATANRANNAVELGDGDTATVAASGVVANYQETTSEGSVSAEIGTLEDGLTIATDDLNNAGVIVRVDADGLGGANIQDSTISISENTVVSEVNGNVATNATSASATTVSQLDAKGVLITAGDLDVNPQQSDLATASLQKNASTLSSDVAATFAIIDNEEDIDQLERSTQIVSDNLQQSYATANLATNSVDLTATNTDAQTALESVQISEATVGTTSDLDVVANAGAANSSLTMGGNQNQSVANGNVATNETTLDVTNATVGASTEILLNDLSTTTTAGNVLASRQSVTADVSAGATTDVYNQDVDRPDGNEIVNSTVSLGSNATIAQATGNNGTQTLTLGDAGTSTMERNGVLLNNQTVTATTVSSTVDQDVSVALSNTGGTGVPVQASSLSLDGNSTTALARSNVSTNTLNADGANIDVGGTTNASFDQTNEAPLGTPNPSLSGAYILGSVQSNTASVTATTNQARVEVDMSHDDGNVIDTSTLSLSDNASSATALANTAVNSVSVGANAANVNGAAALGNNQTNTGGVEAIGRSAVRVLADTTIGGADGINGSSVMLSGNSSASSAVGNQAQNTLTASGANITSGAATSAELNAQTPNALTADAGNLLLSDQVNTGLITSTNIDNVVTIDSDTVDGAGAAAEGSTLSVAGNTTEARATANLVLNSSISIGGASTTSADATGLIGNFQFNDGGGDVTASASTNTTVDLEGAGAAGALSNGSAMMQGNSTLALARGNVSQNVLTAEGANVAAGASPATVDSNGSPDQGELSASYGVFNEQVQQATVDASSTGATYAINATSGTGDALNGASAAVGGNSVNASAFGNVATNSVSLTSLNGASNDASAAVFNGQINSGAIKSTVTGASIGTFSVGGVVSASVGVSGNSISATSVGNFASSSVTRASR